ncbi:MAG: rhomboid family intramembrane serine protease [Calditrichia bacterium]
MTGQLTTISIIIVNVAVSLIGFKNRAFFKRYAFSIKGILQQHQYDRLLVSTFLHADYVHLLFNMFSFYSFAFYLAGDFGSLFLILLFLGSAIGGDLLVLIIHRNHPDYRAVGASGGVAGVIFSAAVLFPGIRIMIFPLPFGLTPWLFSLIFVAVSVFGVTRQAGNIGHEAHLGGALSGIVITALLYPSIVQNQLAIAVFITLPVFFLLIAAIKAPHLLGRRSG